MSDTQIDSCHCQNRFQNATIRCDFQVEPGRGAVIGVTFVGHKSAKFVVTRRIEMNLNSFHWCISRMSTALYKIFSWVIRGINSNFAGQNFWYFQRKMNFAAIKSWFWDSLCQTAAKMWKLDKNGWKSFKSASERGKFLKIDTKRHSFPSVSGEILFYAGLFHFCG